MNIARPDNTSNNKSHCKYQSVSWLHSAKPAERNGKVRWIESRFKASSIYIYKLLLSYAVEDREHSIFCFWLNVWELDCVNNIVGARARAHITFLLKQIDLVYCQAYIIHLRVVTQISECTFFIHYCGNYGHNCPLKLPVERSVCMCVFVNTCRCVCACVCLCGKETVKNRKTKKRKPDLNGFGLLTKVEKNAFPLV